MVEADLIGQETHGVFRLRQYVNRLRAGGFNPTAHIKVIRQTPATALVDGDNGFGHLAMKKATELAIAKAAECGIGWVGVRNSNHAGPAALYVSAADPEGHDRSLRRRRQRQPCPALRRFRHASRHQSDRHRRPRRQARSLRRRHGHHGAALGKIKTLVQRGEPMPEGWMVGRDGRPLTDPNRHEEGYLLQIGGPKGYGLSMAIGLLAGTLNGAAFGRNVVDFTHDKTSPTNTGQFVAAISVSAFAEEDEFGAAVDTVFDDMRASEPLPGHEPVRIPGERREAARRERIETGVPLHPKLRAELQKIAGELGIADLPG